jgi:TolB-like protein/DNA-binding winged helix-turn-helix (wHTH) protein
MSRNESNLTPFRVGDVSVEPDRNRLGIDGHWRTLRPRTMNVLVALSRRAGEVTSIDDLIDLVWDGRAVTTGSLYNSIAELRQALDGSHAVTIETIPKRGYRLSGEVELASVPSHVDATKTQHRRYWMFAVLAMLSLAAISAGLWSLDQARRVESLTIEADTETDEMLPAEESVAVLPFRSLGAGPDTEFLSAGIAEEVLSSLALVPRLRVISGHSSFAIDWTGAAVPEIAERLNATVLVSGSVRMVGEELRISARLVDARTDTQVWAQDFDRQYDNVLAMQSEISAAIVEALRTELGLNIGDLPTTTAEATPEAHEAYLRGRLLVRQRSPDALARAVEEFELATEIAPDYARAHAELAIAIALDGLFRDSAEAERERLRYHAERAYALDPDLSESNAALAWFSDDGEDTLAYLRRAVEINPNYSDAWYWIWDLGISPLGIGDRFAALERAVRIDPLSQPANWDYIYALVARNRVDDAIRQIDKYESLDRRGATFLRGLVDSLGGNTSAWVLGYLDAASTSAEDLIFGRLLSFQWKWKLEQLGLVEEMLARHEEGGRMMDLEFEVYFGDTTWAIEQARAALRQDESGSWFPQLRLGQFLAHTGQLVEARPYLERGWQGLEGADYLMNSHDLNSAIFAESLIAARHVDGDVEGAKRILDAWRDSIQAHRAAGVTATYEGWYGIDYHEGIVAWYSGERQKSLHLLGKAVEDGFSIPPPSAFQRDRYEEPAFAKLFERQAAIQRRERHKVLAVVCSNNPYADVWQPMDATCSNYRDELAGAHQ